MTLVVALLFACSDDTGPIERDAGPAFDAGTDGGAALSADAGASRYAFVGEEIALDGSASTGAATYEWALGDGRSIEASADPIARVAYDRPGRFSVVLTVRNGSARRSDTAVVTVTERPVFTPSQSSTIARIDEAVAVVVEDADQIAIVEPSGASFAIRTRVGVGDRPRTLARYRDSIVVACEGAAAVALVPIDGGAVRTIALPAGSAPFGVAATDTSLFVSLRATGELVRIDGESIAWRRPAIEDARGVAILPDGRVAVSRWRSPDERGEIAILDADGTRVATWTLAYDPQPASDTETGGVPSYLEQILVAPAGDLVAVPSLQAAIGEGLFRSPRPLTHESTVRAVLSIVDPVAGSEDFEARKQFDNRGFASSGVFTSRGDYLFVGMPGARSVERLDMLRNGAQSGTIFDVGFAPEGLALSADDRFLFVNATLSRELVVYDVSSFEAMPVPLVRVPLVEREPLAANVLRGKQLFHDAADPRLARESYIACGHCHRDGLDDRRVWDFTDRGEGLRNTIALAGRGGAAPIHWSGNFDEVQDFEHDIRGAFGGTGLLSDADFHTGTRDRTLGDRKAGVSADLDALAAYVESLDAHPASPFTSDPAAIARGRGIFESAGCAVCHEGADSTDSAFLDPETPLLHDVGTLGPGSGQRLGAPLAGIDTPTLRGLFDSAPYLHDGSAATLDDVLTTRNPADRHGRTSDLDPTELADLVTYLRSL
jgi:PKD repeat protein